MGVASVVMKDVASNVLRDEAAAAVDAAGDVGPIGKLQAVLTKVKGKAVEKRMLFRGSSWFYQRQLFEIYS